MSRQALINGSLVLLITLISGWWAWQQRLPSALPGNDNTHLTSMFENVSMTSTDRATGLESVTLHASRIVHYESQGTSELTQPVFYLPDKNWDYWTLRARKGLLNANGTLLQLQYAVSADSPDSPQTIATSLQTERLDIDLKQQLAKSTDRVTILRPGMIQTGLGFEADLKNKFVSFSSKVRSRYDPVTARQSSPDHTADSQYSPRPHE